MIQRVQSLLLLLVAVLSLLLIYLPVYERVSVINPDTPAISVGISQSAILEILNAAVGILAFVTIFLYKFRKLQLRLCNLAILITCVFVALLFFMADTMSTEDRIKYVAGSYLPLFQLLFIFLATRFIKKDENLVRSADRLR